MNRAAWIRVAVLCALGLVAYDVVTRGFPSLLTMGILLSPVPFLMWQRDRQTALMALLFFGVWAAFIVVSGVLERAFNSGSMAGSGGTIPMPLFALAGLFLGWIPAGIVTAVVAVRRVRVQPPEKE